MIVSVKVWCRWLALMLLTPWLLVAERINHEGRILGSIPTLTNAVLFNTPEADAIVSTLQIFPIDNAWNEDISRRPVLSNSEAMISQVMSNLQATRRTLRAFYEMNFVLVPTNQPLAPITFDLYGDESDPSPYPIPSNLPIETWPRATRTNYTLYEWQRDIYGDGGDRHAIIVQPGSGNIWETWQTLLMLSNWHAANGAKFNLNTNALRPLGWTSADAAGLSMLGGLVRYDECQRGMVEHALRLVVARTRRSYIYPATHYASNTNHPNMPAMGQRFRLKSSFVIPDNWSIEEKAVLRALKKYGALIADNGNFFSISVVPDQRWPSNAFSRLSSISITNFEVIQTTGPTEGPRSPGAPSVDAGPDRTARRGEPLPLQAQVVYTNTPPLVLTWKVYFGPGTVAFQNTNQANATATFSVPGTYTLMFSADDGAHAVAYDALVVTVLDAIRLSFSRSGTNISLRWQGGTPPYYVETAPSLTSITWTTILTTNGTNVNVPMNGTSGFFRIRTGS